MTQTTSSMRSPTLSSESAATWAASEAIAYIHDGIHIFANEPYIKLFKFSDLDEILATPFMDMVAEECRKDLKLNLRICQNSAVEAQPEITRMDVVALDAEKAAFPANLCFKPTHYEGESCLQVLISSKQSKPVANTRIVVAKKNQHRSQAPVAHDAGTSAAQLIASALEHDKLVLVYQPVVSTFALEPAFYEICPQMRTPDGARWSTDQLTAAADEAQLTKQLDRWVFTNAIRLLGFQSTQGSAQQFQLTLSCATIRDDTFCEWLDAQLIECGVKAGSLVLNMRECDVLACAVESVALVTKLHEAGSRVCISGYTNHEQIAAIVSECKIDFVRFDNDISEANSLHMLSLTDLKRFVAKLHNEQVKVIAADVQDKETVDSLWLAEVDLVQGTWFQKEAQELHAKSFRAEAPALRNAV